MGIGPLDRERMGVFVFGPGEGEAIALFLPTHGWMFIDACRRNVKSEGADVVPQLALRRKLGPDDPVFGVLLTHPHEDHADGFADLVRTLKPAHVFVTGTTTPARDLVRATELSFEGSKANPNDTKRKRLAQVVHQAAVAIRQWEEDTKQQVEPVHAGVRLLDDGPLRIDCVAPAAELIPTVLESDNLPAKANHLSIVLRVTFGDARILLTGDLPWVSTGTTIASTGPQTSGLVASGWERVATSEELTHHAMKVPHHGSREALHPRLLTRKAEASPRRWVVTPKNGSLLPKFWGHANGVDELLEHEPSLLVSSLPSSWEVAGGLGSGRTVQRSQLVQRSRAKPTGDTFADAGDDIRPRETDPRETVWMLSVGRDASIKRERGAEALELVRG